MSYFFAGLTIQYRIKPNEGWITINISGMFLKTSVALNPTIDISGLESGKTIQVRVRIKNERGFCEYGEISEILIK